MGPPVEYNITGQKYLGVYQFSFQPPSNKHLSVFTSKTKIDKNPSTLHSLSSHHVIHPCKFWHVFISKWVTHFHFFLHIFLSESWQDQNLIQLYRNPIKIPTGMCAPYGCTFPPECISYICMQFILTKDLHSFQYFVINSYSSSFQKFIFNSELFYLTYSCYTSIIFKNLVFNSELSYLKHRFYY